MPAARGGRGRGSVGALSDQLQHMQVAPPDTSMPDELARQFKLMHLTNHCGPRIYASEDPHEGGVPETVVWTQLCQEICCPGFGERTVYLRWGHLKRGSAEWNLWYLGSNPGSIRTHTFHKFVLAPASQDFVGRGWQLLSSGQPSLNKNSPPQAAIFPKLVQVAFAVAPDVPGTTVHRHVGVLVDWLDTLAEAPVQSKPARLSEGSLNAHNMALAGLERRQFNCTKHGPFWKKCEPRKPVAQCFACKVGGALGGDAS